MHGRTIKLYIMGSEHKHLKTAELSNWTGLAYIGERKHIPIIQKFDDVKNAGLYFLIKKECNESTTKLYIGETDNVAERIKSHQEKDWWDSFVAFISKDSNLTKAHVRYLEKSLCNIAKRNSTTIELINSNGGPGSKLPESDKADMAIFEENIIFVLNNLNIIDFTTVNDKEEVAKEKTIGEIFYMNLNKNRIDESGNILNAKLIITDQGYKLLKGSYIETKENKSFFEHCISAYNLRKKLEKEGNFDKSEYQEVLVTNKDLYFKSPSAASDTVKNASTNGRTVWKLKDGTTLDEFEAN